LVLTVISIIVTAYRRYRIATGNNKLVIHTDVICCFWTSDIELYKI